MAYRIRIKTKNPKALVEYKNEYEKVMAVADYIRRAVDEYEDTYEGSVLKYKLEFIEDMLK